MGDLRRIPVKNRNFDDFRKSIENISKQYYPEVFDNFNDASVGSWFLDLYADIADTLSYHIDKTRNETSIDSASSHSSIVKIAKNRGIKIPGPKSSVCEVEISCILPLNNQGPVANNNLSVADEHYAPIIKKGTLFSSGAYTFELMEDVDFSKQFNSDGFSDRQTIPNRNSNGIIESYTYKKITLCHSGTTRLYRKVLTENDIVPFMEVEINDSNITGVESVIVREGINIADDPNSSDFLIEDTNFNRSIVRYREVNSLSEQSYFSNEYNPISNEPVYETIKDYIVTEENGAVEYIPVNVKNVTKGRWYNVKNKFECEHIDKDTIRLTFGSGLNNTDKTIPSDAKDFTQHIMSRMYANDYLGVLPKANTTLFVQYRVGGGSQTNVGKNTVNKIINLNAHVSGNCNDGDDSRKKSNVLRSISVTNPTPSYGGKDMMSTEELKHYIKYYSHSSNRCVTLKDYVSKVMEMPSKYGVPFRCNAIEENNKIVLYCIGMNYMGNLIGELPNIVIDNIKEYLSKYKMINDLIEIRSGKVVNLSFEIDVIVNRMYDKQVLTDQITNIVKDFFDVKNHVMGGDIYIGLLEKKISDIEGILNMVNVSIYNPVGGAYSNNPIRQELDVYRYTEDNDTDIELGIDEYNAKRKVNLNASDKVLYSDVDTMYEVRYNTDIKVNIKER